MATKKELAERQEAIEELRAMLKPGQTIYTVLRHVSKSGMSRDISLHIGAGSDVQTITWLAARALGWQLKEVHGSNAIRCPGCGMDMGFHLVYSLSRVLFPDGFRPRDAGKSYGRNGTSADELDTDGGYCLQQHWI